MEHWINRSVSIITNDGRNYLGTMKGFDQHTNVILEECFEVEITPDQPGTKRRLGLYIVRGDNIAIVGEVDEEKEREMDYDGLRGEALKPVVH